MRISRVSQATAVTAGLFVSVLLAAITLTAAPQSGGGNAGIVGVWRPVERTYTGPNARKITNPQPGLRIFTRSHYSITEVTADNARPALTAKELEDDKQMAAVARPFTGQAGTYEIKGNELTVRRIAAVSPYVMSPSAFTTYTFALQGNTLTMTTKANENGPIADPTTVTLTRVE